MTASVTDSEDWLQEIRLEHNQLRALLSMLEVKVGGAGERDDAWARGVASALDAVVALLAAHFEREEAALPPEQAERVFPKLAASIARLNAQHAGLLAEFRAARAACSAPSSAEVESLAKRAIASIRAHEREETALFADVDLSA